MSIPDEQLPEAFRQGLVALRERHCPDAAVVGVDGNFAIVDLGSGAPPEAYVERAVRVYARAPLDIINAEPYGVITLPLLHRRDGAAIGHQHASHANARLVVPADGSVTGFWSWNWSALGRRTAEDLALMFEWAWKCLRDGAR